MDIVTLQAARAAAKRSGDTSYGKPLQLACRSILDRMHSQPSNPLGPVTTDVPTVSIGTSATLNGRVVGMQTNEVTVVGSRGNWIVGGPRMVENGFSGLDFFFTGDAVEIDLISGTASTFAIYIDGRPISTSLTDVGAVTSGTRYYVKLAFSSNVRRRIEVFATYVSSWYGLRGAFGSVFEPAPRRPITAFLGDSFFNGYTGVAQTRAQGFMTARMLGVEPYMSFPLAAGSTGYVTPASAGVFGSTTRLNLIDKGNTELVVIQGTLNDDANAGTVQAAATQLYSDLATRRPNMPIIVLGPEPSGGPSTGTQRTANNIAVKAAAVNAPNVIAFFDTIGTSTGQPGFFSGSNNYVTGDLVRHLDSVWRFKNDTLAATTAGAPGGDARWELLTWGYYGTGRVGATAGNGSRDVLLANDATHPSELGALVLAGRTDEAVRRALVNYANTGQKLISY